MIGQIYKRAATFEGAFEYLNGTMDPAPAFTFTRNLPTDDVRVAEVIMSAFGRISACTDAPAYRFRVFFHPADAVPPALVGALTDAILKELGADELQAVVGYVPGERHHLYAVLNLVHPQRLKVWSSWRDMPRMMRCLRRLERECGLREVVVPRGAGRGGERRPGGFRGPPDTFRRPRRVTAVPCPEIRP